MINRRILVALAFLGLVSACGGPNQNAEVPEAQPAGASDASIGDHVVHFSAQSTDQLSQALGVDEISIRQSDTGETVGDTLDNQIGVVGKRLSSRAYLSYEQGLTDASTAVTKLTYRLTPKIRIVTQAGTDSAIDIFYTFQFD